MKEHLTKQKESNIAPFPKLWTPRVAAEKLGYKSHVTILRAFRRGELRGYKLSARAIRFDPSDVLAWASRLGIP